MSLGIELAAQLAASLCTIGLLRGVNKFIDKKKVSARKDKTP